MNMIETDWNEIQITPPDVEAIAARSRRADGFARQRPRREREHRARLRAVALVDSVKRDGWSCRQTARRLHVPSRTLANWCHRNRQGEMACLPRGRPCKESTGQERLAVTEFLRDEGPYVSLPSMRQAFPETPPCELDDLRLDYWEACRCHNRIVLEQLTWHVPGRVWAMDHAKPPKAVDGIWPAVFAVRDLASGMVLDWLPVPDETSATTRDALLTLFVEFGPPLVLKSDNGSAFKGEVPKLMEDWGVIPLRSPAKTPRYNGSCEAGIGGLKNRTRLHAALDGHHGFWTSEDTEAARWQCNEFHYSKGYGHPAPLDLWKARTVISEAERDGFHLTVERIRVQIEESIGRKTKEESTAALQAAVHRRIVRQALEEFGILSAKWRFITLPIKPKKCARIM